MSGLWIDEVILTMKRKPAEKLLLALICFRASGRDGHCHDSNKEMGKMLGIHFQNVSEMVQKFKQEGLVNVAISKDDANARTIDPISHLLIAYQSKADSSISKQRTPYQSKAHSPISDSLTPYTPLTDSHNKDKKPLETKEENEENVNTENAGEDFDDSVIAVDAEEVDPDDKKNAPNPQFRPPPSPGDLSDSDRAELDAFTRRLLSSTKLIYALSSGMNLKGEAAQSWIEAFALDQWTAGDLNQKTPAQWDQHCKRWIADKLAKQTDRDQQRQSTPNHANRNGHRQSRAETGSEIDRLVNELLGS